MLEKLCTDGMYSCAFDAAFGLVFGVGSAVILLLFIAAFLGFNFDKGE